MNRTPKEISLALKTVYADNIIKYKLIHMRPHPTLLLTLLLLSNINDYKVDVTDIQEFYETNKKRILEQINKIIKDFDFKENELLRYSKKTFIKDNDFNLIQIFSPGIKALHYACLNEDKNLINIINSFSIYWGGEHILEEYLSTELSQNKECKPKVPKRIRRKRRIKIPTTTTGFRCKP